MSSQDHKTIASSNNGVMASDGKERVGSMDGSDSTEVQEQSRPTHLMPRDDPDNPMNFPLHRKIYVSLVASFFTFVLLFAASSYTAGLGQVVKEFNVKPEKAVLGLSVFIFGIIPAPLVTPHLSERFGRNPVYFTSFFIMSLFILGASRSQSFSALLACRFFSGLFGGPVAVNIEGSYADMWPAMYTGSYYTFITCSQYFGAATGAILGGTLVQVEDWRWTQYVSLMLALAALLFAVGVPETYPREIMRQRARKAGVPANLVPAPSGATFGEMSRLTLVQPLKMLFLDPVVALIALYMALNFGVLFQWFITVPATLTMLAGFDARQDGLAFVSAIGGTALAAVSTIIIDQVGSRVSQRRAGSTTSTATLPPVEHRLVSAMIGAVLLAASIFWVGNTASPKFNYNIPIVGTAVYVWGSAMSLTGFIGYLFDSYQPQAILSALSIVAYARLATAAWLPLVIMPLTNNLTPKWGFNLLGFFAAAFIAIPVLLFLFGARWRENSRFYKSDARGISPLVQEMRMGKSAEGEQKA